MTAPDDDRSIAELPVWQPPVPRVAFLTADEGPESDDAGPAAEADDPTFEEAALERAIVQVQPARARPVRRTNSTTVLLALSAMVAIGGISFAVGRVTSSGATSQTTTSGANAGANGFPGFDANASGAPDLRLDGAGGGPDSAGATISGTVVSVTADSITIQEASGQTVTIATGSSTAYHSQTSASATDVATGATVVVQTSPTVTGTGSAAASASPGTVSRTATDVTITGK